MKSAAARGRHAASPHYPARVRWFSRLALLTLTLQLASLGHWSVGPFHAAIENLASHSTHCHGDTSACGGQPSFAGTYIERPLAVTVRTATQELTNETRPAPQAATVPALELPPKAA